MNQNNFYKDKICLVTGANSGIGYALSEELLNRGATVYMAGRNPEKVAKAAEQLAEQKDKVHTLVVDVTKQEQVQQAIEGTAAETGGLDMLFNNAGVGLTLPYENTTLESWQQLINTNLWSVIYGVHAAVPIMLKQGSGYIVNTSSIGGLVPVPFQSSYNCTKYAITGLTESLRYEYAEKGLHFSAICPAYVASEIYSKEPDGTVRQERKTPESAYPADKAASYVLGKIAEYKGIIIVPEEPYADLWKGYILGDQKVEEFISQLAHLRREAFETGGDFTAMPPLP